MNNYERIKSMNIAEMTDLINSFFCTETNDYISCKKCVIHSLCDEINKDYMKVNVCKDRIVYWLKEEATK